MRGRYADGSERGFARGIAVGFAAAALGGCAQLGDIKDKVEGVTNRFVLEGFEMGLLPPEDDTIASALAEADLGEGARVTAFLADATEADQLEDAPIEGADVSFVSSVYGSILLREEGDGAYTLDAGDGLAYVANEEAVLRASYGGANRSASLVTPQAPRAGIDGWHEAGSPLEVDLRGQGFDAALVTVLDTATGEVSFSNLPETAEDFYDLARGAGELVVTVPGGALASEGFYAVGVAGVVTADEADFVEVNTALSSFMAACFRFSAVCTLPDEALCEAPPAE